MFDHVGIRVSDREASERFYDTVLAVLGKTPLTTATSYTEWERLRVIGDGRPGRRSTCTSPSTPRPTSSSTPSTPPASRRATRATARPARARSTRPTTTAPSCSTPTATASRRSTSRSEREPGQIDHLWLRTHDLDAVSGLLRDDRARRRPRGRAPTRPSTRAVHSATALVLLRRRASRRPSTSTSRSRRTTNAAVDAFHEAAIDAGYTDNGAPGERADLPPRLLRRLRARPRRPQHRGRQPQPLKQRPPRVDLRRR